MSKKLDEKRAIKYLKSFRTRNSQRPQLLLVRDFTSDTFKNKVPKE
jgi:hypothetical protein